MENTLMHYGILGMKWGVRRTPEQLGHVRPKKIKEPKQIERRRKEKNPNLPHYNRTADDIYRNMDQMTDKELQDAINRLRNQVAIEQMSTLNPSIIREGENYARRYNSLYKTAIETAGTTAAILLLMKKLG